MEARIAKAAELDQVLAQLKTLNDEMMELQQAIHT
jgi:hypothetical protein